MIYMTEIEKLEKRIESLSPEELSKFRNWFIEFDARQWDHQIEADSKDGKLDRIVNSALADYKSGRSKEI
jgi:hypothetical protein